MALVTLKHNHHDFAQIRKLKDMLETVSKDDQTLNQLIYDEVAKVNTSIVSEVSVGSLWVSPQSEQEKARQEVKASKVQIKRQEIHQLLVSTMTLGVINKKEFDIKVKLLDENQHLIERAVDNPEEDRFLEQKLGIVITQREVLNISQVNNAKVDKDEFKNQVKDAAGLVKKLNEERKERELKKKLQQQVQMEKMTQEQHQQQLKKDEEDLKREEEKKKQKDEILRKLQEKEESRRKFNQESEVKIKEVIKTKPLYKQLEEKYIQEVEMPHLEQKKKQLEELRSLYKPLERKDFMDHAANYERNRQNKFDEAKRQRDLSLQADKEHYLKHKPRTDTSVIDQKKLEEEQLAEEKKKLVDKHSNYAKYVKEMYFPKVSETKKLELEQLKDNLKSQKVRRSVVNLKSGQNMSKLQPLASARNKKGQSPQTDTEDHYGQKDHLGNLSVSNEMDTNRGQRKVDWKKNKNSMAPTPKSPKSTLNDSVYKSMDYLKEIRLKREKGEADGTMPRAINESQKIEKLLKDPNLNEYERMELVKRRAEIVEKRAFREEQLIKASKGSDNIDKSIAVNDKYIEAITAKLKILDQI